MDESYVDEIHNKYLKKHLKKRYDEDEELFKNRTHYWDDIAEDGYVPNLENNLPGINFTIDSDFIWEEPNNEFLHHDLIKLPNGNY